VIPLGVTYLRYNSLNVKSLFALPAASPSFATPNRLGGFKAIYLLFGKNFTLANGDYRGGG